ncbi:unnamed protein product [Ilex paraguariensis]|uniref:Uncharacterized protein n=1 Tax=Ilex paraguariensis TaxID=185542 RepID=A0ABC8V316_9AQUA
MENAKAASVFSPKMTLAFTEIIHNRIKGIISDIFVRVMKPSTENMTHDFDLKKEQFKIQFGQRIFIFQVAHYTLRLQSAITKGRNEPQAKKIREYTAIADDKGALLLNVGSHSGYAMASFRGPFQEAYLQVACNGDYASDHAWTEALLRQVSPNLLKGEALEAHQE